MEVKKLTYQVTHIIKSQENDFEKLSFSFFNPPHWNYLFWMFWKLKKIYEWLKIIVVPNSVLVTSDPVLLIMYSWHHCYLCYPIFLKEHRAWDMWEGEGGGSWCSLRGQDVPGAYQSCQGHEMEILITNQWRGGETEWVQIPTGDDIWVAF